MSAVDDETGDHISIGGPVERVDGRLVLRIPLEAGGRILAECARGISSIENDLLVVVIPDWLAQKLGLFAGSQVIVDNKNGKFNIQGNDPRA